LFSITQKMLNKGRRVRTDGLTGFSVLWVVAGLRRYRRKLLRHQHESQHLMQLLNETHRALPISYSLAVEILQCQRLIKGYSDTHSRGQTKFKRVIESALASLNMSDAAQWVKQLREAALKDEQGNELEELLRSASR